MSDGIGKDLFLYTHAPGSTDLVLDNLRPGINSGTNSISTVGTNQFSLSGYRLNGVTEGAYYGDDAEMSTNYPLIRFKSATGNYYYGITSGWSNTGIEAPGNTTAMTTNFKMSDSFYNNVGGAYDGNYLVEVVVNGIASSSTPWTLIKNLTTNTWQLGAPPAPPPGGRGPAGRNGWDVLLPVLNQATVVAGDNAVTVAAQSGKAKEQPLERSETGGETSSQPIEWETAVARVLGNQVTSLDPKGTELAFLDLEEGDLISI